MPISTSASSASTTSAPVVPGRRKSNASAAGPKSLRTLAAVNALKDIANSKGTAAKAPAEMKNGEKGGARKASC